MTQQKVAAESDVALAVRPASAGDVPAIFDNINYWAQQGKMLVRPMQNIFENLRDYFVAERIDAGDRDDNDRDDPVVDWRYDNHRAVALTSCLDRSGWTKNTRLG